MTIFSTFRRATVITGLGVLSGASLGAHPSYTLERRIPLPGNTGWDLLALDSAAHRLYVSRGVRVDVVDTRRHKVSGTIEGTSGVHGIAVAADLGKGYTSNGISNTATIFDLKTLAVLGTLPTGERPDVILYDSFSKQVFVFNAKSQDCTVIDAVKGTVSKTLVLLGKPELAVSDGAGRIYVNLEDKSSVASIDVKALVVTAVWPLAPGESPTGLALDSKEHLLFSACDNKKLIITDALTGKQVAEAPIGNGPDGAGFDPGTQLAFSSNGEGTLSIVQEKAGRSFEALGSVVTQKGARTMVIDPSDHRIYLLCAKYAEQPAGAEKERKRPAILDGSVEVLVLKYTTGE